MIVNFHSHKTDYAPTKGSNETTCHRPLFSSAVIAWATMTQQVKTAKQQASKRPHPIFSTNKLKCTSNPCRQLNIRFPGREKKELLIHPHVASTSRINCRSKNNPAHVWTQAWGEKSSTLSPNQTLLIACTQLADSPHLMLHHLSPLKSVQLHQLSDLPPSTVLVFLSLSTSSSWKKKDIERKRECVWKQGHPYIGYLQPSKETHISENCRWRNSPKNASAPIKEEKKRQILSTCM